VSPYLIACESNGDFRPAAALITSFPGMIHKIQNADVLIAERRGFVIPGTYAPSTLAAMLARGLMWLHRAHDD